LPLAGNGKGIAMTIDELLDDMYRAQERLSRDDIQRAAVAADLPAEELALLDALPEGEYSEDEVVEALRQVQASS
jgi:hypothetical protein